LLFPSFRFCILIFLLNIFAETGPVLDGGDQFNPVDGANI